MALTQTIRERLADRPILLMTHLVLGYPSFEVNRRVIAAMAEGGVDLIELQIPFSEPMADGPVINRANQEALARGVRVADCLDFAQEMAQAHPGVRFLFMTYYNIVFRFGETRFLETTARLGLTGTIIPDLPLEEGEAYRRTSRALGLAPIVFFTPTSSDARMRRVAECGDGFVYTVARRGVTGAKTEMGPELRRYLERCRAATSLPLAVGFGIAAREDVAMLRGLAEIAVVGTATIRLVDRHGPEAVLPYVRDLLGAPQTIDS